MIHRLALALASVAAVLTLALALGLAGLTPAPVQLTARSTETTAAAGEDPATNDPNVQVDTIYVEAPPAPQVVTVHRISKTGVDDEHESGGDD